MRDRIILFLAAFFALGVFLFDIYVTTETLLPAFPYAISILIAAYFLSPRAVVGVALFTLALQLLAAFVLHIPFSTWSLYVLSVAAIGFLAAMVAIKVRHEAELTKAAEASRREATNILESITDAFFAVDREWRLTYVNEHAEPLLRHRGEELIGRNLWDVFPEAVGTTFYEEYHRAVNEQVTVDFQDYYVPFGTWFEVRAYPNPKGLSVYFRDITKRVEGEEALHRSEQRHRLLFETMLQGVIYHDAEGTIVSVNPVAERILGRPAEELLGQTAVNVALQAIREDGTAFPGLDHPSVVALRTGREVSRVVMGVFSPREQRYRWINISAVPIFHEGEEKPYQVYTLFEDITERRQAEAEREQLLAELAATFASLAEGLMVFDLEGRLVRMNPAAESVFGYSPGDYRIPLTDLARLLRFETVDGKPFPPEDLPGLRALRGETVQGVVLVIQRPRDARTAWISASAAPVRTPNGELVGAVTAYTDITSFQEAQEHHEDFVRALSHDLRNPLTVILAQAQVARRMAERTDLVMKCADAVITSARRMESMIHDLVDSVRLEAGQFIVNKRPLGLESLVPDLLERASESMAVQRIKLDIPKDLPPVVADPDALERILLNLVTNALKYAPSETDVHIRIRHNDADVVVCVIDTGQGISSEDVPHIFERFHQPKAGRKPGGLGLGLYISRMLVEAHGGRVSVESTVGKGSTFCFALPVA